MGHHDAADEAGRSRLYGGIHIPADDFAGAAIAAAVGSGLNYVDGSLTKPVAHKIGHEGG